MGSQDTIDFHMDREDLDQTEYNRLVDRHAELNLSPANMATFNLESLAQFENRIKPRVYVCKAHYA